MKSVLTLSMVCMLTALPLGTHPANAVPASGEVAREAGRTVESGAELVGHRRHWRRWHRHHHRHHWRPRHCYWDRVCWRDDWGHKHCDWQRICRRGW